MPPEFGGVDDDTYYRTCYHLTPLHPANNPRLLWQKSTAEDVMKLKPRKIKQARDFYQFHTYGQELTNRLERYMGDLGMKFEDAMASGLGIKDKISIDSLYSGGSDGLPLIRKNIVLVNRIEHLPEIRKFIRRSKYPFVVVSVHADDKYSYQPFIQCIVLATIEEILVIDPFHMYKEEALRVALADVFQDYSLLKIICSSTRSIRLNQYILEILETEFSIGCVNLFDFGSILHQRFLRGKRSDDSNALFTDGYALDRFICSAYQNEDYDHGIPEFYKPSYKELVDCDVNPLHNLSERPWTPEKYIKFHRITTYLLHGFWIARVVLNQGAYFATRKPNPNHPYELCSPILVASGSIINEHTIPPVNTYTNMIGSTSSTPWIWDQQWENNVASRREPLGNGEKDKDIGLPSSKETRFGDAFLYVYLHSNDPADEHRLLMTSKQLRYEIYINNLSYYSMVNSNEIIQEMLNVLTRCRDQRARADDINAEWMFSTYEIFDFIQKMTWKNYNRAEYHGPFYEWTPTKEELEKYEWARNLLERTGVDIPQENFGELIVSSITTVKTGRSALLTEFNKAIQRLMEEIRASNRHGGHRGQKASYDRNAAQYYRSRNTGQALPHNNQPQMASHRESTSNRMERPNKYPVNQQHGLQYRTEQAKGAVNPIVDQSSNKDISNYSSYKNKDSKTISTSQGHHHHNHEDWVVLPNDPPGIHTFKGRIPERILKCLLERKRSDTYNEKDLHEENVLFIPYIKIMLKHERVEAAGGSLEDILGLLLPCITRVDEDLKRDHNQKDPKEPRLELSIAALEKRVVQWSTRPFKGNPFVVMKFDDLSDGFNVYKSLKTVMQHDKDDKDSDGFGGPILNLHQSQSPLIYDLTKWSNDGLHNFRGLDNNSNRTINIYYNLPVLDTYFKNARKSTSNIDRKNSSSNVDTCEETFKHTLRDIKMETGLRLRVAEMRRNSTNSRSQITEGEKEVPWFYISNELKEVEGKFYIYMNIPSTKEKKTIISVTLKDPDTTNKSFHRSGTMSRSNTNTNNRR